MNKVTKIIIVIALVVVVGIVVAMKQQGKEPATPTVSETNPNGVTESLPRLVDLGAGKCIPCKMMKPILDELTEEYKDQFKVTFIDVWENPEEKKKYNINLIPTQIFYDSTGKELFRHEGFFSKEDILGKWKEFGINFEKGTDNEAK